VRPGSIRLSAAGRRAAGVDKTGIEGLFDFTLTWGADETGPSIFTTLQEQHGLKLESTKTTFEIAS